MILLALAAGVAATTITKAKVFQPLRSAAKRRSSWLGYLVSCPYCVSHWLVFALQAVYRVRLVHSGLPALDVIVSSFPMIGLAVLVPAVLTRVYRFDVDKPSTLLDAETKRLFARHIAAHEAMAENAGRGVSPPPRPDVIEKLRERYGVT